MCKTVTKTITFCHTEALGMQIQRGTINNHKIKKKKGKGEQNPVSHFSENVLIDSRLVETFLLPAWATEPRPSTGRRGILAEGVVRKWVWLATASQNSCGWALPGSRYPQPAQNRRLQSRLFSPIAFEPVNISSSAARAVRLRAVNAKLSVTF